MLETVQRKEARPTCTTTRISTQHFVADDTPRPATILSIGRGGRYWKCDRAIPQFCHYGCRSSLDASTAFVDGKINHRGEGMVWGGEAARCPRICERL